MSRYYFFLIFIAILVISGIFVFVLDYSDLSWTNNKETYWGLISMMAFIGFIILNGYSKKLAKDIEESEK